MDCPIDPSVQPCSHGAAVPARRDALLFVPHQQAKHPDSPSSAVARAPNPRHRRQRRPYTTAIPQKRPRQGRGQDLPHHRRLVFPRRLERAQAGRHGVRRPRRSPQQRPRRRRQGRARKNGRPHPPDAEPYKIIDSFGDEYVEGIVAGVPSLMHYDVELDSGVPEKGASIQDQVADIHITAGDISINKEGSLQQLPDRADGLRHQPEVRRRDRHAPRLRQTRRSAQARPRHRPRRLFHRGLHPLAQRFQGLEPH